MVYSAKSTTEILHKGQYKGYEFCILNLGTHPTAYVECKLENCSSYEDERLDNISVHGGFTYFGKGYWENNEKDYLGWDYAHYMDYAGYELMFPETARSVGNKKWTTSEIFEEVKSVINQLFEINEITVKRDKNMVMYHNSSFEKGYFKALLDVKNYFDTHSDSLKINKMYNSKNIPKLLQAFIDNRERMILEGDSVEIKIELGIK